jgi:uncharacterized protein with ParB-like and HNH nuclease domain
MEANETKVEDFLSSNKIQFVIPIYQRNYDWSISQCKQLLDDILEVGTSNKTNVHFIGSLVYVHDDVYTATRIKELTIIDGQQRITTLTLIYLVLHRLAIKLGNKSLANEINETYLINKYAFANEKLKLRLTENNDKAIKYLLRSDLNEEFSSFSKVIDNFNYFKERITEENFKFVLTGLSKLMFVEISLDRAKDAPQRIFESLNSTGLELSQADLIRNYILMGLNSDDQNEIYTDYWKIIEKLSKDETLNTNRVSDFIRDYLTLVNNKIPNKGKVYLEFKSNFPTTNLEDLKNILTPIKSLAKFYNKLINPKNETDNEIRIQLKYIKRLEINVSYPFLMKVYEDYSENKISKDTFIEILDFIQSFTWRRFVIGLSPNGLNKIFMTLYEKIEPDNYLISLQQWLLKRPGSQRFPKDKEVIDNLKLKDVYSYKSKNRVYFLEKLENYQNKEFVSINENDNITIEHIFPQNPDPKWKIELGEEQYKFIKETYLNTIANLTLSGNNGNLGNKTFLEKREMNIDGKEQGYKYSRLWLNRFLANEDKWDKIVIEKRFAVIKERFLNIWKLPDVEIDTQDFDEINIFDAENPTGKKLEYAIFFDQKLEISEISKLYIEVITSLFDLSPKTFFTSELEDKLNITKNPNTCRSASELNDTYFMEVNLSSYDKFERLKKTLKVFGYEDELMIKYK